MRRFAAHLMFCICLLVSTCSCMIGQKPTSAMGDGADQKELLFFPLVRAQHLEFYAAPNGSPLGDGSLEYPWDLATALAQPKAVVPGAMIWLRGGTYRGSFVSKLTGTAKAPITVRQYQGERVIIDTNSISAPYSLEVEGAWTIYWGFEVTNSHLKRTTAISGSFPDDLNRSIGVNINGPHTKFVNLVVHDVGIGFGAWDIAQDAEIYGSLIYNNGWQGPDRGHGHAIYVQSDSGTKRIVDNIMFNQFSHGIHAYAQPGAALKGFYIAGNISFNNGSISMHGQSPNILIGGEVLAEQVTVENNYTYDSDNIESNVNLAYGTTANKDLLCRNNYFVGGKPVLAIRSWSQITMTGNQVIGNNTLVEFSLPDGIDPALYQWNNNVYYGIDLAKPFDFRGQETDFAGWQLATQFDGSSTYAAGPPAGIKVIVRPNQYEPGRAHIVVYNWDLANFVDVDVSSLLPIGAKYEVRDVNNYFGTPIAQGIYNGTPLRLPLAAKQPPDPIGGAASQPPVTGPSFSAFVFTSSK